jgi:hypothetical protein
MSFEQWQAECAPGSFRFYSLGRHALAEALRAAGIGENDKVLLPEFLCRDILASLHTVGAEAAWYPVGEDLRPASPAKNWSDARAVLAVNYFGFPQSLEPFRAYAVRTGAMVIEDNAHGFLSRDENGMWLGTRADVGIFSLRKTLPIADGAALLAVNQKIAQALGAPLVPAGRGYAQRVAWKAKARKVPVAGIAAANALTDCTRLLRWLRSGDAIPRPDEAAERTIPCSPAAHRGLMKNLAALDIDEEVKRRRKLYREAEATAISLGLVRLFQELPALVSPYGFPLRTGSNSAMRGIRRWARRRGVELIRWPDLPVAIANDLPAWQHNVWLVNFL